MAHGAILFVTHLPARRISRRFDSAPVCRVALRRPHESAVPPCYGGAL